MRGRRFLRKVRGAVWNDKVAAAHTVFFLVAAALFLPIVAGLFLFLKDTADSTDKSTAGLRIRAVQGLNQVTGSSGLAGYTDAVAGPGTLSSYWENLIPHPDFELQEIGLVDENLSALSYEKVDNLQRGGLIEDTTDAYVNYPEFKDALRLGDDFDFHIRLYPIVQNTVGDPYGMAPIKDAHVAYVANLTHDSISLDPTTFGEWTDLSPTALQEIAALKALKLTTGSQAKGFDGKAYQPRNTNPSNNPSGYTNLLEVKQGDVIGDTSNPYTAGILSPTTKSYPQWFTEDYLWLDPAKETPRFDVIVFGSNADLSRWGLADGSDDDVREELHEYLKAGGSIIFLGNVNLADDFVTKCTALPTPCLLSTIGAGEPVSTPDVTNQMLTVPNELKHAGYTAGTPWNVCTAADPGTNLEERNGWIPVEIVGSVTACVDTVFGATTSDRYGRTGGTLIVASYDINTWSEPERAKFLANTVLFAVMRSAFLDYGPPIPVQESVESAERLMLVELPTGDYVDTKIVFYLWKNDCTRVLDPNDPNEKRGDNCLGDD